MPPIPTLAAPLRLTFIDALRGYAILAVMVLHVGMVYPDLSNVLTGWGQMGVDLFFCVSAFTLAASWTTRREPLSAFYLRRLFRIVPMFWCAIILYVIWAHFGLTALEETRSPQGWQILLTALLLQGLHPGVLNMVVPGDWSVAVELNFYALFPLLMATVTNRRRALLLLLAAQLVSLAAFCVDFTTMTLAAPRDLAAMQWLWLHALPLHGIAFAAGLAAFWATRDPAGTGWRPGAASVLAVVALLVLLCTQRVPSITGFALAFGCLTFCLANGAGRFLDLAPIRHLGKISFSVYLVHFTFVDVIAHHLRGLGLSTDTQFAVTLCGVLAVSYAVCSLTYALIERPMIDVGNALIRRRRERLEPLAATAMTPSAARVSPS